MPGAPMGDQQRGESWFLIGLVSLRVSVVTTRPGTGLTDTLAKAASSGSATSSATFGQQPAVVLKRLTSV